MRLFLCIFGLSLALLVASSVQARSRGFAWFFAHSRPIGSCSGQHVVATYYVAGRRTASGQRFDPSGYTAAQRAGLHSTCLAAPPVRSACAERSGCACSETKHRPSIERQRFAG
jgi:hypothetical protein